MPIKTTTIPASAATLSVEEGLKFIIFVSSDDPATGEPWCPDVRASLPHIQAAFGGRDAPELTMVHVGQKPEWRAADNAFRTHWNVQGVPTLARYENTNGQMVEVARLDEIGIMDNAKLKTFMS